MPNEQICAEDNASPVPTMWLTTIASALSVTLPHLRMRVLTRAGVAFTVVQSSARGYAPASGLASSAGNVNVCRGLTPSLAVASTPAPQAQSQIVAIMPRPAIGAP